MKTTLLVLIIGVIVLSGCAPVDKIKSCPLDACSDGSQAFMSGPNCDVSLCPETDCTCPEGYYLEGQACNPNCYRNEPRCMVPSIVCTPQCGTCPMLAPPSPGFCPDGNIVAGEKNACGCQGPPRCVANTQIANPASTYCVEHGGQSVIVTNDDGSQSGNCILPNSKTCDEWAYFRGECS